MNRVVARYVDGTIVKGSTSDFSPGKPAFHLCPKTGTFASERVRIDTKNLKALFFVRDLAGNPQYAEQKSFDATRRSFGRKIKVEFDDGEILLGTTMGYRADREGFFVEPADPASNNERCYVLAAATRDISFLEQTAWERQASMGTAQTTVGYA